jgi:hypothetical protein
MRITAEVQWKKRNQNTHGIDVSTFNSHEKIFIFISDHFILCMQQYEK